MNDTDTEIMMRDAIAFRRIVTDNLNVWCQYGQVSACTSEEMGDRCFTLEAGVDPAAQLAKVITMAHLNCAEILKNFEGELE